MFNISATGREDESTILYRYASKTVTEKLYCVFQNFQTQTSLENQNNAKTRVSTLTTKLPNYNCDDQTSKF